jgi:hypothetical protein
MEWPSQSPDFDPIENLRAMLKKKVYACKPPPKDLGELQVGAKKIWKTISPNEYATLVASMHDRAKKVQGLLDTLLNVKLYVLIMGQKCC